MDFSDPSTPNCRRTTLIKLGPDISAPDAWIIGGSLIFVHKPSTTLFGNGRRIVATTFEHVDRTGSCIGATALPTSVCSGEWRCDGELRPAKRWQFSWILECWRSRTFSWIQILEWKKYLSAVNARGAFFVIIAIVRDSRFSHQLVTSTRCRACWGGSAKSLGLASPIRRSGSSFMSITTGGILSIHFFRQIFTTFAATFQQIVHVSLKYKY